MRLRALHALGLAVGLATAGCVHYPSVMESGGTMVRPEKGRAVRHADGASVYFELKSTGKYSDVITAVHTPVAKKALVVDGNGLPLDRLEIPGATVVSFSPSGPHVELREPTRPLVPGETVIVTLVFDKLGGLGVICVVE